MSISDPAIRVDVDTATWAPTGKGKGGGHLTPLEDCSSEEYYRRVLCIPYMDSIISSLAVRFRDDSTVPYSLLALHPHQMTSIDKATFILMAKRI